MKQLLFAQSIHSGDGAIAVHTFFVNQDHLAHNWDGRSPLDVHVDILVEAATIYLQHLTNREPQFARLEFTSQVLKTGDRFYFFTVTFTLPIEGLVDDFPETIDVVMTLDYKAIEPEVRYFDNDDEHQQYMVLQKLINQVGDLDSDLEAQIRHLSREQLWRLDIAAWGFTSMVDLHRWLSVYSQNRTKLKSGFCW